MEKDDTIPDRWLRHAALTPERDAVVHWRAGEPPFRWKWGPLLSVAAAYARRLEASGVQRGDVCALVLRHHERFYPLYLGICSLGALPSVLAYPNNRLHPDKFREGLSGMAKRSGLDWLLTEEALHATIEPLLAEPGTTIRGVLFPLEWSDEGSGDALAPRRAGAREAFLLQHSSGTTGLQKGVVLSHHAILEHVQRYGEAIAASAADRIVSWLPLYHDMGLIAAFHLPLALGIPVVQLDPFEWVSAPVLWAEAVSREAGTLSWLPNFAYNLMADRIRDDDLTGLRLDSIRMLINCSEPVRAESHARFAARFEQAGLRREALAASYAMAEATFAVTQTPPGREARTLAVDSGDLAHGRVRPAEAGHGARLCVSSGPPLDGCELNVVGEDGRVLPEGRVGELAVRSVSLFDGYHNRPAETAAVLRDGWYHTGDYGFLWDGECYVSGRKKDVIIVGGRNVFPEDVEAVAAEVPGVLPGRVVAFAVPDEGAGTEQVCLVAESAVETAAGAKQLRRALVLAAMGIDVTLARVYLAPPRWLIKSSAGKLSRAANRERALAELSWS